MKIKKITEGVRYNGDSQYIIDMRNDYEQDIIHTCMSDELYYSNIQDNVYVFGYKFRENASREQRTNFLNWLKSHKNMPNYLSEFINRPLIRLQRDRKIPDIDLVLYPRSGQNEFVPIIVRAMMAVLGGTPMKTAEAVKAAPSEITIDYDALRGACKDDYQYNARLKVVEKLLEKIRSLEYFSLSRDVKMKYRGYIRNFLKFNLEEKVIISSIQKGAVLIIDDVNTSNSTLNELIRKVKELNKDCEIYIFTLIGKSFD